MFLSGLSNKKVSRAAMGGPKQRCNAAWRNAWRIQFAGVRHIFQVRAGGTVRKATMNEVNNGSSAVSDGFSALSLAELRQIEGGASTAFGQLMEDTAVAVGLAGLSVYNTVRTLGRAITK